MSSSQQAPARQEGVLPSKVKWMFALDTFSQQWGIAVTLIFMNMFMTNFLLMTPVIVAGILTVGRLVDLAVSSVSGAIVQKGNLKTGPLRTWLVINGPLLAVGNLFIFLNPNVSPLMKIILFTIGYCFRNLPQSFLITASNAMVAKVAGANMTDRLALTAKKMQGINATAIITSMLTVPLCSYFNSTIGNGRGYLIVSLAYCVIHTAAGIIVYINLAPYDQYDPHAKKVEGSAVNVKVTHMYADTFKNPQVWILMIAGLAAQTAMFTVSPLNAYYYTYVLGNINYMAIVTSVGAWLALGLAFVAPPFAKKLGKKNSFVVGYAGMCIGSAGILFFSKGNFILFFIFTIFNRVVLAPSGSVGINMWGDAAEYQLYKTGRDSRPFIMSLNSLMMKIGQLISSFTYAYVLQYCNFRALGPGRIEIDVDRLHSGQWGVLLSSYVIILICYICFGINEQKSREYAEANRKMLAERAAAAAAAAGAAAPAATAPAR